MKHFFVSFDSLIAPTICSDAYMFRTSDFNDDRRQTNRLLNPLPHMRTRGNNKCTLRVCLLSRYSFIDTVGLVLGCIEFEISGAFLADINCTSMQVDV